MEINVNQKLLNNDPSAKLLIEAISDRKEDLFLNGSFVYHEFPIYLSEENKATAANVLVLSKKHGLIIFQCGTDRSLNDERIKELKDKLDQVHSQIYSKLLRSKILRINRTTLFVRLTTYVYLPHLSNEERNRYKHITEDIEIIITPQELVGNFETIASDKALDENIIKETLSILEGSKAIIKPSIRPLDKNKESTKGKILEKIESQIATFDAEQKRAALHFIDGPQRIRGLAGSGKTIVLTMKAALLHLREPEAEILYTFYTKSLYSFIKRLITRFYREYSERDPNWEKIHILHAWGGKNLPGVYYNACIANGVTPVSFNEVKSKKSAFDYICKDLYEKNLNIMYDYSLLDEGQDFPHFFYRLCRKLTRNNRIIWGYDECQNIFKISIQDPKQTFGVDEKGQYYIDFSRVQDDQPSDLVLYKCYRNPRRILVYAFALGLGIYNNRILQMPENNEHWKDLGFEVKEGNSKTGDKMTIFRPEEHSPLLMNKFLESNDVVKMHVFKNMDEECAWVAKNIMSDLKDELLPEDILVISLDDFNAREYFNDISHRLAKNDIMTYNLLDTSFYSKNFRLKSCITLSTVYRAKGNEAASVYVIGVDAVYRNKDSIQERNKIFTAMTRAKAWVFLTGSGDEARLCKKEIDKISENYPKLIFKMPDRNKLNIFQRDLTNRQDKLNQLERDIGATARALGMSPKKVVEEITKRKKKTK